MKKILSLMAIAVTMMAFTACSDDTADWYQPSSERVLEVQSADVTFKPNAQNGTIVVNSDEELTATSNADWCTVDVDGNTINVTVTWNNEIESRNAVVTIASNTRSVQVPVHQSGLYIKFEANKVYSFQATDNAPVALVNESNCDFDVVISTDWIHVEELDGIYQITVDENAGENYRNGRIDFSAGEFAQTVYIGQLGTGGLNVEGTYSASWDEYDENNNLVKATADNVQIVKGTALNTYLIKNLVRIDGVVYDLELNQNTDTGEFYMISAYSPGTYGTYTLRCLQNYYKAGATEISYATAYSTRAGYKYRMSFDWTADDEANLAFGYVANPDATEETPGFGVYAVATDKTTGIAANIKSCLKTFWNLRMIKE